MSLTLDDLAATSGTAAKDLALKSKELTQKQPVVQVPVARTTERRAQRQLAYDETKKTVNEWDDTIDAERKTSSLNFGKREAEQTSTSQLASSPANHLGNLTGTHPIYHAGSESFQTVCPCSTKS